MSECNHTKEQSCLRGDECAQCLRDGPSELPASTCSGSERPKTFQETIRCPDCLTLGQMRYQFGNYVCDKCNKGAWRQDTLQFFLKAFEAGQKFERQND